MYCKNCGKEIDDKAVICIGCGCLTGTAQTNNSASSAKPADSAKSAFNPVVGFILSLVAMLFGLVFGSTAYRYAAIAIFVVFVLPVAALISSVAEYMTAKERKGKTALALTGIIISAVVCFCWAVSFLFTSFINNLFY